MIRRREFVALLGGAAVAWPRTAQAQQRAMPSVGFLGSASPSAWAHLVSAFRQGLNEAGYVEGRNVTIEYRWAEGQYERRPGMAAELVRSGVAVLVSTGGEPSILAAKAATATIPIVFTLGSDPVALGLVASLSRPGGNITGVNLFTTVMDAKRLGLLHDMVPTAELIATLVNPRNPSFERRSQAIQQATDLVGVRTHFLHASTEGELNAAFEALAKLGAGALFVGADPFFNSRRHLIVKLAASHGIPAIYEQRDFAEAGGLMSYGTNFGDSYRQAGIYTGRILNGEKPAELPVVQSTKFEFVINLKTAKALGIDVPLGLSAQADEVIE